MARADILKVLYSKTLSPLEFKFESLMIPSMYNYLTPYDVQALNDIATSVKYNANRKFKEKEIDRIMVSRSFRRFHCGTNRVVYRHLEDPRFVAKIALDRTGIKDNPREFKNQTYLKPFVTKVFEVSPCGTVGFVEKVEPITSREEFLNIANDVFDVLVYGLIGLYALDDVGTDFFMNWGVRLGFGPVLLDFPYVFKLDGNKLHCALPEIDHYGNRTGRICDGEIDYDDGFNYLVCPKCGKKYCARDLAEAQQDNLIILKGGNDTMPLKVQLFVGNNPMGESQKETDRIVYTSAPKKLNRVNTGALKVALSRMPNPAEKPKTTDFSKVPEKFGEVDRETLPPVIQELVEQKVTTEEASEKKATPELIVGFPSKQKNNTSTTADQVMITENKKNYTNPVKIPEADVAKPKGGITFSFNGKENTIGNPTIREEKKTEKEGTSSMKRRKPKFNHNFKAQFNTVTEEPEQPVKEEPIQEEPAVEEEKPEVIADLNGVPATQSSSYSHSAIQTIIDNFADKTMTDESTYPEMDIDVAIKKVPSSDMVSCIRKIISDLRSDIEDGFIEIDENADSTSIDHSVYKYYSCTADSFIRRYNGDIFFDIVEDEYPDTVFKFRNNIKKMYPDINFDAVDDTEYDDDEDEDDDEGIPVTEEEYRELTGEEMKPQVNISNYEPLFPRLTEDFKRMCKESLPEKDGMIDAKVFKTSGGTHVFIMPEYEGNIFDAPIDCGDFDELFDKISSIRGVTFPDSVKTKLMEEITDDDSFNVVLTEESLNPEHTVKREQHHTDPSNLASF